MLKAWPETLSRTRPFRALVTHQFWRKVLGTLGPRYVREKVGSLKMYLELEGTLGVSRFLLKHGHYDPFISRCLKEWIGPSGNVIDVGANIGYYTLLAGTYTRGQVYAFEPDPHNYEILINNVELNHLRNVSPFQKAAGASRGIVPLYLSKKNSGDHQSFSTPEDHVSRRSDPD